MQTMNPTKPSNRIVFLDNIRALIIMLVLVFHAGASYGTGVDFWPFHDDNPSGLVDFFMFICDVFFMALMFFIAGYFVLPDLLKKGLWGFIKGKLKRLGLPWLVITVTVLPALDYVHYTAGRIKQTLPSIPFMGYWLLCMKKIGEFYTGWIDMSAYYYMTDNFYQRYMWFISLLLAFCLVFGVIHTIKKHFIKQNQSILDPNVDSARDIVKVLFGYSTVMVVLFGIIRFMAYPAFMDNGWFSLGNIIQFQFGKLVIYGVLFGLGIRAYSGKWFSAANDFWKTRYWVIICFCLFGLNMLVLKNLSSSESPVLIAKIGFCVVYPLWALSFCGLFLSFGYRRWNRPRKSIVNLAAHSYNMYLVHYVVPFTLPLLLSHTAIPSFIKFVIVSILTLVFSYAVSAFVMKPLSKITLFNN